MSEPSDDHTFGFGQMVEVTAEAVVFRNGKPVDDIPANDNSSED